MSWTLAGFSLGLAASQAQASACSQLGHWYWPPEPDAISFGASIGNHEGVKVSYYTDLKDVSNVIEVVRSGFSSTKTYQYRSKSSSIKISTVGSFEESIELSANDSRYLETLSRMRDLVGYVGAPEAYLRPDGGPASLNVGAIYIVKFLDQLIAAQLQGPTPANCVLYKDAADLTKSNACELTGGALFTLGPWRSQVKAVWVRSSHRLTLVKDDRFDKAAGFASYYGYDAQGQEVDGGRLFFISEAAGLEATTALCATTQP